MEPGAQRLATQSAGSRNKAIAIDGRMLVSSPWLTRRARGLPRRFSWRRRVNLWNPTSSASRPTASGQRSSRLRVTTRPAAVSGGRPPGATIPPRLPPPPCPPRPAGAPGPVAGGAATEIGPSGTGSRARACQDLPLASSQEGFSGKASVLIRAAPAGQLDEDVFWRPLPHAQTRRWPSPRSRAAWAGQRPLRK
jgi:hypothetical protein